MQITVLRRCDKRHQIGNILRLTDLRNAGRAAHVAGSGQDLRSAPIADPASKWYKVPALPRAGSANSFFRLAPAWAGVYKVREVTRG